MTIRLYLFDDARARGWEPFSLTRPGAELVFGALRLWERAARAWGAEYGGHLAAEHLVGFCEDGGPRAIAVPETGPREHRLLVSSRAVVRTAPRELPPAPADLCVDGVRVGWSLPAGTPPPHSRDLADPAAAPPGQARLDVDGFVLEHVWELVARTPAQLLEDLTTGATTTTTGGPAPPTTAAEALEGVSAPLPRGTAAEATRARPSVPPGAHLLGDGLLSLGPGAAIDPGVVLDTGPGPIVLGKDVRVLGPARLEGPLYAADGSTILGGRVSASHIGPGCKIRGEVKGCVLLGYDNKAHDGFLGHAYLGRWVNLGAHTTNSDLRNDYRDVRIRTAEGSVSSGFIKMGCFLGDHVRTAIGTLLNTGAVVGAGCNLFGGGGAVSYVPPFRWGASPDSPLFRLDRFLDAARHVMSRRGVPLTAENRVVLERAWRSVASAE